MMLNRIIAPFSALLALMVIISSAAFMALASEDAVFSFKVRDPVGDVAFSDTAPQWAIEVADIAGLNLQVGDERLILEVYFQGDDPLTAISQALEDEMNDAVVEVYLTTTGPAGEVEVLVIGSSNGVYTTAAAAGEQINVRVDYGGGVIKVYSVGEVESKGLEAVTKAGLDHAYLSVSIMTPSWNVADEAESNSAYSQEGSGSGEGQSGGETGEMGGETHTSGGEQGHVVEYMKVYYESGALMIEAGGYATGVDYVGIVVYVAGKVVAVNTPVLPDYVPEGKVLVIDGDPRDGVTYTDGEAGVEASLILENCPVCKWSLHLSIGNVDAKGDDVRLIVVGYLDRDGQPVIALTEDLTSPPLVGDMAEQPQTVDEYEISYDSQYSEGAQATRGDDVEVEEEGHSAGGGELDGEDKGVLSLTPYKTAIIGLILISALVMAGAILVKKMSK